MLLPKKHVKKKVQKSLLRLLVDPWPALLVHKKKRYAQGCRRKRRRRNTRRTGRRSWGPAGVRWRGSGAPCGRLRGGRSARRSSTGRSSSRWRRRNRRTATPASSRRPRRPAAARRPPSAGTTSAAPRRTAFPYWAPLLNEALEKLTTPFSSGERFFCFARLFDFRTRSVAIWAPPEMSEACLSLENFGQLIFFDGVASSSSTGFVRQQQKKEKLEVKIVGTVKQVGVGRNQWSRKRKTAGRSFTSMFSGSKRNCCSVETSCSAGPPVAPRSWSSWSSAGPPVTPRSWSSWSAGSALGSWNQQWPEFSFHQKVVMNDRRLFSMKLWQRLICFAFCPRFLKMNSNVKNSVWLASFYNW